jgi:4-hydroxy-tetrahydrodipicolinate reductase
MAEPIRLAISGATGRMGQAVARLAAAADDLEVVGGIAQEAGEMEGGASVVTPGEAGRILGDAEVIVDFSHPDLLREVAERAGGAALVVGTTGLGADDEERLDDAARRAPVLVASNFSVGVNLLLDLAERAARALGDDYDVEIVEAHHRRKEDAPSGTALSLGEAVARGRDRPLGELRVDGRSGRPGARPRGEIGFHALRGGDIVGEHRVMLIGDRERVELGHVATSRDLFAEGALRAARWVRGREPGRYGMADVLGMT